MLDEATASIDQSTENLIHDKISQELAGGDSTIISIAHRIGTVMNSDRLDDSVYVLGNKLTSNSIQLKNYVY